MKIGTLTSDGGDGGSDGGCSILPVASTSTGVAGAGIESGCGGE